MSKIRRVAQFIVLALLLLYGGDYVSARFGLPNGRQTLSSVDVQIMWAIRQKDGRIDYELGDTETRPCLYSLFPHLGYPPCWYLTRHKNQVIKVGQGRPGFRPDRNLEFGRAALAPFRDPVATNSDCRIFVNLSS